MAVAADNLQTEPTIVIEVQEQKNEAVQPELLYSQLAAASVSAGGLDITMPADAPAAAEDTSEVPAVEVTSQHSIHDENGYYVYNGTENDTYNSLTKDGLWVGGVDDNTGFHVDNTGHASANGLDVQNQKITGVADGEFKSGSTEAVTAGQLYDAGIVPGKAADGSVAIGNGSNVTNINGVAIGNKALVNYSAENGVAIGQGAEVRTDNATAIGQGSRVVANPGNAGSVALGQGSMVIANDASASKGDTKGVVSVGLSGNNGFTRRIINVGDGVNDSDAATYGQVKDVQADVDALDALAVQYDGAAKNTVIFAGTNGTSLENVSDIVMNVENPINHKAEQHSFQNAGLLPGKVEGTATDGKWNMAIGEGSEIAVDGGTGADMMFNTAIGNSAGVSQALVDGGYEDVERSTAIGHAAKVRANNSTAIGDSSNVSKDNSVALGQKAEVQSATSIAIGQGTKIGANAENSIAIGTSANGYSVGSKAKNSTVVGVSAWSLSEGGTVLGKSAKIQGGSANGTAIGTNATINVSAGSGNVALGADSTVSKADVGGDTEHGVVSVGQSGDNGFNRRIINVGDGVNDNDAATYGQVKAVQADIDALDELAVTYTDSKKEAVNFNKAKLQNIGDIQLGNATSTFVGSGLVNGKVYDTEKGQWAENGANATHSMAVGSKSSVRGTDSVAVGPEAAVNDGNAGVLEQSTAVGSKATVTSSFSTALGANTQAKGDYSVAVGAQSQTTGANATAIGAYAVAGENSVVVGGGEGLAAPIVSKANSTAMGTYVGIKSENGTALGYGSQVGWNGKNSVALGADSVANEENVVSVGHTKGQANGFGGTYGEDLNRRIVNVADGVNATDAATVGQMSSLLFGPSASFKESKTALAAGTLLTNKGTSLVEGINKNTAAINSIDNQLDAVSDIWETNSQSLNDLTEKASAFAAQTQNVDWNALNSVDWNAVSTMAAVPATMNIAVDDGQANEGDTGAEKDDDDRSPQTNGSNPGEVDGNLHVSGNTTLDGTLNVKGDATFEGNATFDKGATMKGDLNMSGNKITGLGAGDVSADSTDAVNGSQLFDVQQQVSDNRQAIGALGSRVSDLGEEVDSVGAISAALAGLHPLDYNGTGSKFQISAALGTYDGTQAAAIGGFYHFNRDTLLSIGGSTSFEGDRKTAANVGVTFRVGEGASEAPVVQDTETKQQMEAMKQEIEMLKAELAQLKHKDTETADK